MSKSKQRDVKSCLERLRERFPGGEELLKIALMEFMDVSQEETLDAWFSGRTEPRGEFLVRLNYFLSEFGLETSQITLIRTPELKTLGKMIAFRALSLDECIQRLGYANRDEVFDVLLRGQSMLPERTEKVHKLLGDFSVKLRGREAHYASCFPRLEKPFDEDNVVPEGVFRKDAVLQGMVALVNALYPLVEYFASDECDPEERKEIREAVGNEKFFRFTVLFNRLGGERARTISLEKAVNGSDRR